MSQKKRKSAFWIMKSKDETPFIIGSKEDIEYITNNVN